MKGIICYSSGSGNTKLACEYIRSQIGCVHFDLHNIVRNPVPALSSYKIIGFATYTDFGDIPAYFHAFFDRIGSLAGKFVFVFNTYGFLSGNTLKVLESKVKERSGTILTGYSLHTPESYPPMRRSRLAFDHSPTTGEMKQFMDFIDRLENLIAAVQAGVRPNSRPIQVGLFNKLITSLPRAKDKEVLGMQAVDTNLCRQCKTCENSCPYQAIQLDPYPIFDHNLCQGCWSCYNHCPHQAIFTKQFDGRYQYPRPNDEFAAKMQQN